MEWPSDWKVRPCSLLIFSKFVPKHYFEINFRVYVPSTEQVLSLNLLNLYNPMAYFGKHKRVRPHWWNSNCKITKYLNKLKALAILITLFEIKLAPKACTMLLPMLYFTLALPSSIPKLIYIDLNYFFTLWFRRKQK